MGNEGEEAALLVRRGELGHLGLFDVGYFREDVVEQVVALTLDGPSDLGDFAGGELLLGRGVGGEGGQTVEQEAATGWFGVLGIEGHAELPVLHAGLEHGVSGVGGRHVQLLHDALALSIDPPGLFAHPTVLLVTVEGDDAVGAVRHIDGEGLLDLGVVVAGGHDEVAVEAVAVGGLAAHSVPFGQAGHDRALGAEVARGVRLAIVVGDEAVAPLLGIDDVIGDAGEVRECRRRHRPEVEGVPLDAVLHDRLGVGPLRGSGSGGDFADCLLTPDLRLGDGDVGLALLGREPQAQPVHGGVELVEDVPAVLRAQFAQLQGFGELQGVAQLVQLDPRRPVRSGVEDADAHLADAVGLGQVELELASLHALPVGVGAGRALVVEPGIAVGQGAFGERHGDRRAFGGGQDRSGRDGAPGRQMGRVLVLGILRVGEAVLSQEFHLLSDQEDGGCQQGEDASQIHRNLLG